MRPKKKEGGLHSDRKDASQTKIGPTINIVGPAHVISLSIPVYGRSPWAGRSLPTNPAYDTWTHQDVECRQSERHYGVG